VPVTALAPELAVPPMAPLAEQLERGRDHCAAGRIDEAIAILQAGLAAATREAGNPAMLADLHYELGRAHHRRGRLRLAAASYQAALHLAPGLTSGWQDLGDIYLQTNRAEGAIPLYLRVLKLDPAHGAARHRLVEALMASGQLPAAKAVLLKLLGERPSNSETSHLLGKVCCELDEPEQALQYFERAAALDLDHADSRYWIGSIKRKTGDLEAARSAYASAAAIRPLIRRRAIQSPPDFRLLALYAPYHGNTPIQYLFKDPLYDIDALAFLGGDQPENAALGQFDVVVNLISEVDQAHDILLAAGSLTEKLGKPVVNHPDRILRTTRDAVAERLTGIAACRVPGILRLDAGSDVSAATLSTRLPFAFPVLARPVGTHGGDDFNRIDSLDELARFLAERPDADHYIIEYIDYASADGYFRKYRFIFVGDRILPYHLAIGNRWKVHHISTDMVNQPWMQAEEAAFLNDPADVFNAAQVQALQAVRERIGLDYFGIDCGIDGAGHVVVFETNASMLVHDDNAEYPYKDPHVRAIKDAFEALLRDRAGVDRWRRRFPSESHTH